MRVLAMLSMVGIAFSRHELPTHSRCQKLCPACTEPTCKCDDACWPGSSLADTPDKTCECFAQLDFCAPGKEPVYTPGKNAHLAGLRRTKHATALQQLAFASLQPNFQ